MAKPPQGDPPGRRSRGADLEPGEGPVPAGRLHQAGPRATTSRWLTARCAAGGRPNVLVRYPNGIAGEFFYQKRAPESRLPWIEVVSLRFPSGRSADEVVPRDTAALLWMANLACLELHPHRSALTTSITPMNCGSISIPCPGVEWSQIRDVAGVVHDHAARPGSGRLAEDVGLSRHAHLRADPPRMDVHRGPPRRAGLRPRGRAARPRDRDEQVVEGRAPRRLPRLQPEREGSHDRRGVLGATDPGCPRVRATHLGGDRRVRPARLHAGDDAGALRRDRRSARRDGCAPVLARVIAGPRRAARARGTRRRAVAAALPEAGRRTGARAAVAEADAEVSADRDRTGEEEGGCTRRRRALACAPS